MTRYFFSYKNPNTHYLDITFELDQPEQEITHLYLPGWRPGRYQMADFAKNIQIWRAYDENDRPLEFRKVRKDCWEVNTSNVNTLKVQYNYFAFKLDAGNTFLDDDQVFINPVNCALYDPDRMEEECTVKLDLPEGYDVATAMKRAGKNSFKVDNFQAFADSPIIASDGIKYDLLDVNGYKFYLWFNGECDPFYDQIKKDFEAFIRKQVNTFGEFPVNEYHFFFQLPSYACRHGVEHQNSTVITMGPGFKLMRENFYSDFLAISSHELYHTWNIKAIRPVEMSPYRFNEENYTPLGYMAEGVTTYYGDLFLLKSGVFNFDQYKQQFNKISEKHLHNYGRFNLSVAESSFDTWLDGYEAGASSRKTSIYIKGMLIAFLLDIQILKDTGNDYSLDEVMRRLYYDFAKAGKGYSEEDLKCLIEKITNKNYDEFFRDFIWGVEPLEDPLEEALSYLGLEINLEDSDKYWERQFGIKVKNDANYLKIAQIAPGSPAEETGLSIEDELIAVNGVKIDNNLDDLFTYHYEETIQLSIFRKNHLKQIHLQANGQQFFPKVSMDKTNNPDKEQKKNFKVWAGVDF